MDTVTQAVLGGAICHAFVGKTLGRKSYLIGAVLGLSPDLDVLINYGNDLNNFIYHRSFTHSIFVLALLSVVLYFFSVSIFKRRLWFETVDKTKWFFAICLPLLTHPLLDSFTVYGTQLFWPLFTDFDGRSPESWSTLFIIDPLFTLPLLIGLALVMWRPSRENYSATVLGISACYILWSVVAKSIVELKVEKIMSENFSASAEAMTIASPFNTILWRILVIDGDQYSEGYISLLKLSKPINFSTYKLNHELEKHAAQDHIKKMRWFSHGYFKLEDSKGRIIATDLRMGIESEYIFSFVLAESKGNLAHSGVTPYRLVQKTDFSKLGDVYDHFW